MRTDLCDRVGWRGKALGAVLVGVACHMDVAHARRPVAHSEEGAVSGSTLPLRGLVAQSGTGVKTGSAVLTTCAPDATSDSTEMRRGAVIEGRVVGQDGKGISGARVIAYKRNQDGQRDGRRVVATASADARGNYALPGMPAGEYHVAAITSSAAGGGDRRGGRRPVVTLFPGTPLLTEAHALVVGPDDSLAGVDIAVPESRPVRVTGRVYSRAGRLEDGAHVMLSPALSVDAQVATGIVHTATLQSDGEFVFAEVLPGEYMLSARSMPQAVVQEIARTGRSEPLMQDAGSEFGTQRVSVAGQDVTDVAIEVVGGGIVSGRVSLGDQPFTLAAGLRGAIVARPGPDARFGGALAVPIEQSARFRVSGVEGLFFLRTDGAVPPLRAVLLDGRDVSDAGIRVAAGESIEDVQVILEPAPTQLEVLAPPAVRQVCMVVAFASDPSRRALPWSRYIRVAPFFGSSARIVGLPPGSYEVALVPRGDEQDVYGAVLEDASIPTRKVDLRRGERETVVWSAKE